MIDNSDAHGSATELPLQRRLEGLAAFLPVFEDPNFSSGEWETREGTLGWYTLSEDASRFVQLAASLGWVTPDVDWVAWISTDAAQRFVEHPETIDSATPDDLSHLLTALVRQDRFVEGASGHSFEAGLLTRIVRRADALLRELQIDIETDCTLRAR